ncbi:MAG: HAD-IB family phosphatase [Clostridia bacterium]|nr:HAD-IB family phosphatase [Clostridia bacterium]
MKTIIFDFDKTLTTGRSIWKRLWNKKGYEIHKYSKFVQVVNAFREGKLSREEWNTISLKALRQKGLSQKDVASIANNLPLIEGIEKTLETLKQEGYKIAIVCGGVEEIVKLALGENGKYVDIIHANKFFYDRHGILKSINSETYHYEGKQKFVESFMEETGTTADEIIFIGHGDEEQWANTLGCKAIAFNVFDTIISGEKTKWDKVIYSQDLTDILPAIQEVENEKENY